MTFRDIKYTLPLWIIASAYVYWVYSSNISVFMAVIAVTLIWILWTILMITGAFEERNYGKKNLPTSNKHLFFSRLKR